jgi:hypothetical protein
MVDFAEPIGMLQDRAIALNVKLAARSAITLSTTLLP